MPNEEEAVTPEENDDLGRALKDVEEGQIRQAERRFYGLGQPGNMTNPYPPPIAEAPTPEEIEAMLRAACTGVPFTPTRVDISSHPGGWSIHVSAEPAPNPGSLP